MRLATPIILSKDQKNELRNSIKPKTEYRLAQRINAILLASEGENNKQIAQKIGLSAVAVSRWRNRFAKYGIAGLNDLPRSGKPAKYSHAEMFEMIDAVYHQSPLKTRWTLRELARKTGISKSQLHRFMHEPE